ncbi:MAG: DNA-processing protein DprA [Solirubrobacteraceae bacterium]
MTDGVAAAAHAGTLEAAGGTVAVMGGGLDVGAPAGRRSLYERVISQGGCAVAELPCGCRARRWGQLAGERIVAGLADLTVVVEAAESTDELTGARIAQTLGRAVAAVPGRVTSPCSSGTNKLLMEGAHLVRGPGDVLELLYLLRAGEDSSGVLMALSELELLGLLARGDGGRYVPREPLSSLSEEADEGIRTPSTFAMARPNRVPEARR